MSAKLSACLLAAVLAATVACARKPENAQIASDIQNKFSQDSGLSGKSLTVESENGVVTLAGTVDNDAQREAAARQAVTVPGVKQIINNLQVGSPATDSSTAAVQPPEPSVAPANAPPVVPTKTKAAPTKQSRGPHTNERTEDSNAYSAARNAVAENSGAAPSPAPADTTPSDAATSPQPPPPAPPKKVTITQGTPLAIRLVENIDSETSQLGQTFHATLDSALTVDGETAVPQGSDIAGHIADIKSASKFAGQSLLALTLDNLTVDGKSYSLSTDQYKREGSSRGKSTAAKVGGGAILGGIIGAVVGGGKGAAIGAAAGGGAGGAAQAASKAQQIKLPSETVLNFTLQAPVTVTRAQDPAAPRPKLDPPPQ
jgi:hypothetical protein